MRRFRCKAGSSLSTSTADIPRVAVACPQLQSKLGA